MVIFLEFILFPDFIIETFFESLNTSVSISTCPASPSMYSRPSKNLIFIGEPYAIKDSFF